MSNELKTIEVIRKEMSNYISEGRTSAFGGGTKLPMDTTDAKAQLTGNYQNILYTKEGEDKVLTLAEFKCGKITDTTAVNHNDTRLVSGTNIQVSVKEISGQFRNKIVFV
tara:strand:+ start:311 stop:640 length:330 start_codon:yes stop_codon:yes gene_type:complete